MKFPTRIIKWQKTHGRHDLPWQHTRDAYRVWLSEIMLQQTQVSAVIPYYTRFLQSFPTVASLAAASDDEVMQHWAGLGYYARARNLHRAAKLIVEVHGGVFPDAIEDIHALPGIGRSTAAAISAFAFGKRAAILDGNVKRVFARHFGVDGDVKSKPIEDALWAIAERELPRDDIEAYTQGLMDLGAGICARANPACLLCPVNATCVAHAEGRVVELPGRGEKREVPHRAIKMLVMISSGEVLLEKRPPTGIWGGLWSLPEIAVDGDALKIANKKYAIAGNVVREMEIVPHGFTHYSLSIYPVEIAVKKSTTAAMEPGLMWVNLEDAVNAAIPAPVKRILKTNYLL